MLPILIDLHISTNLFLVTTLGDKYYYVHLKGEGIEPQDFKQLP